MRDNVELIESLWDAFSRGDLEKVAGGVAPQGEIVFPDTVPWGGTYRGPDGFIEVIERLTSYFSDFKVKPEMILGADDDHVIVVVNVSGRGKGGRLDMRAVWLYKIRDGKVSRGEVFPDSAAVLEAIG
jgi:ketosteroid isomerase-like protein